MDGFESSAVQNLGRNRPAGPRGPNREAFRYYSRLRRVQEHLEANISESLSLTQAAAIAGLNPKYFSGFFRDKVGVRYTQWVHSVRVERAMRLLEARNFSITYLAFCVGYRDLRTFERALKRRTSITPQAYKRRVRPDGDRPVG